MRRIRRHFVVWMTYRGATRIAIAVAIIVLAGALLHKGKESIGSWSYWSLPLSGVTIAIDAGHGGADGGAVSRQGVIEKDLNLAIALHLRDYLGQAGALVVMTREGDYDLADGDSRAYSKRKTEDLHRRAALIAKSDPAAFISIHMNSIPSDKWSGAQTFYQPSLHPDNKALAALIQDEIRSNVGHTTRVAAAKEDVYLLNSLRDTPAALVEVGFLSHPGEAARLADAEYQRKAAAAIYRGILRYMSGEKPGGSVMEEMDLHNGVQ